MPSSHSPKNNNMDSPGRNGQNGARMIRPSAWPPHPDREIEEKEIWSPEKTNGLNIFEDVTTEPSLVPYEEETKVSFCYIRVSNPVDYLLYYPENHKYTFI